MICCDICYSQVYLNTKRGGWSCTPVSDSAALILCGGERNIVTEMDLKNKYRHCQENVSLWDIDDVILFKISAGH